MKITITLYNKTSFILRHEGSLLRRTKTAEYAKNIKGKPDMGKICIRFKKPELIPLKLIGKLVLKITPQQWMDIYEKNIKR